MDNLPMFSEYAMDFKTGTTIIFNGGLKQVFGKDALQVWIYKALHPQSVRFEYAAHTAAYGNELWSLPGSGTAAIENRIAKMVRETLLVNPYIESVENFSIVRSQDGVSADFTVNTVYGSLEIQNRQKII